MRRFDYYYQMEERKRERKRGREKKEYVKKWRAGVCWI